MSGEASSVRTAATCAVGRVVVVLQAAVQARDDDLGAGRPRPAPRRRASASTSGTSATSTDHSRPAGRAAAVEAVGRGDVPDPHCRGRRRSCGCRLSACGPVGAGCARSRPRRGRRGCGPARRCRRPGSGWTRSSTGRSRRRRARRRSRAGRRSSGSRGRGRRAARPASPGGRSPGRRPRSAGRPARGRRRSRSCRRPAARPAVSARSWWMSTSPVATSVKLSGAAGGRGRRAAGGAGGRRRRGRRRAGVAAGGQQQQPRGSPARPAQHGGR